VGNVGSRKSGAMTEIRSIDLLELIGVRGQYTTRTFDARVTSG